MERFGERHIEAELIRLEGEIILRDDPRRGDDAERRFHDAIDVARAQAANSLELRATLGLARLERRAGTGFPSGGARDESRR